MIYRLTNEYRTQRNNRIAPTETCQVTATIMALEASGIGFECPDGVQPEDYLAGILDAPEAHEKLKREFPTLKNRAPREVHSILSWAINERLVRSKVSLFTTRASLQELLFRIARYRTASLVSGRFTPDGHIAALIGFESDQIDLADAGSPATVEIGAVRRLFIDDPWGDWTTGYTDRNGDDVSIPLEVFNSLTREYGQSRKKWAHLFSRDGIF